MPVKPENQQKPVITHFFGYKGGQARSTVMAVLARQLAESGLRVLMVDADLEAPSLPVIVGKQPRLSASTLLGLHLLPESTPKPVSCVVTSTAGGVDFLAARLPEEDVDLDYDAFTLKALFDPSIAQNLGSRIRNYASTTGYDAIFIDQRTGSSPATLNWFDALPGGICIFARLDGQWQAGARFYRILIEQAPTFGAAIVSFKPDEENPDTYRSRTSEQIAGLSNIIERAFFDKIPDLDPNDDVDPAEGVADRDRWVMWPYDQAFRISRFPASQDLGEQTRKAVAQLRDLLELPEGVASGRIISHVPPALNLTAAHSSGAMDSDLLIHTPILRELRAENSSIGYIFGRKGTGKTRLFQAMVESNMGTALVASQEFQGPDGLLSNEIKELPKSLINLPPATFWWRLLIEAVKGSTSRSSLKRALALESVANSDELRRVVNEGNARKVFLIDGLETAFQVDQIQNYVKALFEVLGVLQSDAGLREGLEVKLFLRTDLKDKAIVQNLEQQLKGRERFLAWDLQGILNFMLSRVTSTTYPIFSKNFPTHVSLIRDRQSDIAEAGVSAEDAFSLLLPMFPQRVRRVNALMRTFLTLHFADSSSEGGRYYPRFVLDFFSGINQADQPGASDSQFRGQVIESDRLSSTVVQWAFDEAAKSFLLAVRQELEHVVKLNADELSRLLNAFAGKLTPFKHAELVDELAKLTSISQDAIQDALETFKSLGLFEDRPGFTGEWRTGRIFRSALRMKLRR